MGQSCLAGGVTQTASTRCPQCTHCWALWCFQNSSAAYENVFIGIAATRTYVTGFKAVAFVPQRRDLTKNKEHFCANAVLEHPCKECMASDILGPLPISKQGDYYYYYYYYYYYFTKWPEAYTLLNQEATTVVQR